METRCPFLKEEKVAFCRAFPIKKMLPFDRLYLKENICSEEAHIDCPVYKEQGDGGVAAKKLCPYLEVEAVIFCGVYPKKKMIPSSAFRLECPCTTEAYVDCFAYQKIAQGDLSSAEPEVATIRGFLFDNTVYHYRGHIWLQQTNGRVRVGLDDFGQWLLGRIDEVILPTHGGRVRPGHLLAELRCTQGTANLISPLSGTVVGVNSGLHQNSSTIHTDPYGEGWLLELQPAPGELSRLDEQGTQFLRGDEARSWLDKEVDRLHYILQTEIGVTMSDGGEPLQDLRGVLSVKQWRSLITTFFSRKEE